jgi:amino acid transporter/mannitol/fructose-specific phosphotransferase system IIA component (Ntr-type)
LAYFLAAIFVIPALFSKAELATAMPKSGGVYFFINRSFGALFGTFAGFASWFSLSLKSAFALLGIGIILEPILPSFSTEMVKVIAILFTLFFTILNILSVGESGRFQVIFVFTLILLLVYYIFTGIQHVEIQRYADFVPYGWKSVFTVTGLIFISFGGLTKVACVAEEIKNPTKTIPRGMFSAFFVVSILYVLVIFVTVGILGEGEFRNTLTPISLAASKYRGNIGFIVLAIAALLAFITTANAGLMAASRDPLAMSRDNLLPRFFSKVNMRFKTPVVSILLTSAFMIACITFLDLENLVKVASTMKLLLFTFVNLSVIIMRESRIVSYKPAFKTPLYPFPQIAGIIIYLFLIFEMGKLPLIITAGFFVMSLLWYFLYSKSRNQKQSALVHIVERITSKDIKTKTLSDELRDILIVRDKIVEDRFDRIIKDALIIDIEEKTDMDGLFNLLADNFSARFNVDRDKVFDLLKEREKDSTTVIHKGLAIPHIIIDGESLFDIIVVRSKKGIKFTELDPVHMVFALAGTKDERNFHLKALMAIAQIVQNPDFSGMWVKVRSKSALRNLILLAERVRKGDL